jgi:shikimate kinase
MRLNSSIYKSLFLVGPMGVGKTTVGKLLARELSLKFIDSDQEIEIRAGADISWIFDVEGEPGFRERETKVIDILTQLPDVLVSTGGGCILSENNRAVLKSRGVVVFLDTSLDIQEVRTKQDQKRPLLRGVDRRAVLTEMKAFRDPLYHEVADIKVFVGESSSKRVVASIIDKLKVQNFIEDKE